MNTELEDQISRWVDDRVAGVEPVTVDEGLERASTPTVVPMAGGSRRRWRTPAVAAAAVVLAGAIGFVALGGDGEPQQTVVASSGVEQGSIPVPATRPEVTEPVDRGPGGGGEPDGGGDQSDDGWTRFVEPTIGWAWEQPAGWSVQSQRGFCPEVEGGGLNSTFVSNSVKRYPYVVLDPDRTEELGCAGVPPVAAGLVWSLPEPLPADFVGFGVVNQRKDLFDMDRPEGFPFPLSLERIVGRNAIEVPGGEGWTSFLLRDDGWYRLMVYLGSDVSDHDRAALERMIASMEETGDPMAHPIRFSWQPTGAGVAESSPPDSLVHSASARLELTDVATGTVDEDRSVDVSLNTAQGALLFTRVDMESAEPEVQPELIPGVSTRRQRVQLRGVEVVHDSATDGDTSVSRLVFFDFENLAVEVLAQNVADDELYQIIEGLQLVAVGVPAG